MSFNCLKPILLLLFSMFVVASVSAQELFRYKSKGKWGFCDKNKTVVIPLEYDDAYSFSEGLACVKQNNKWGFIDKSGKVVIPLIYDYIENFSEGLVAVMQNGKYGFIDKTGRVVVPLKYDFAYSFSEGLAKVKQNGKFGFIDKTGRVVVPLKYDGGYSFSEGLVAVMQNGKSGFIDKTGKVVVPLKYDGVDSFSEGLAYVKQNGKCGFIDKSGNVVIPLKYDNVYSFSEGLAKVKQNGKYGFIDKTGKIVVPLKYDNAWPFSEGLAVVKQNGKRSYIDKYNNLYETEQDGRAAIASAQSSWANFLDFSLGTFDAYLKKNGVESMSEQELKAKVQNEINRWQVKDEFESTAQWQARVNEQSRAQMAQSLAKKYIDEYNAKVEPLKKSYADTYKEVFAEYVDVSKQKFSKQEFTLKPYDADNQTYLISTEKFGDILLPVPLSEARDFKQNWDKIKSNVGSEFVIAGNDMALKSVSFGKYVYDSNTKANYAQVEADYNFNPINISNINYDFNAIAENPVAGSVATTSAQVLQAQTVDPTKQKVTMGSVKSDVDEVVPSGSRNASNTFALIIANADYAHASHVANAKNDGDVMAKYFNKTLGIPQQNISLYHNATLGNIIDALSHLKQVGEAYGKGNFDVIFYYVGHGLPDDSERKSYLLPVDVNPRNTRVCISLEKLYLALGETGAKSTTVMLDACFSGTNHGDGMLVAQSMGAVIKGKQASPVGNMVVLSAAQDDETAFPYESKGHGLFTYWVLKKLQETKGDVTLGELAKYVSQNVKKVSVVENHKLQSPSVAVSHEAKEWESRPLVK